MNCKKNEISQSDIEKSITFPAEIIVLDSVDSTNTYAKRLAQNGAKSGCCVIAKSQTNGRGRLGRSFFSPSDTGIYMSIIFRPESELEKSVPHTIVASLAVCRVLETFSKSPMQIKWVNDIFCNGKKVCGILTEGGTTATSCEADYYIVGIGINTSIPKDGFPEEIKGIAGAVSNINESKNQVIASVISEFFDLCKNCSIEKIIDEYKKYSLILGKNISYIKDGKIVNGIAMDINLAGNLIIATLDNKTDTLISGEISLGSENFTH